MTKLPALIFSLFILLSLSACRGGASASPLPAEPLAAAPATPAVTSSPSPRPSLIPTATPSRQPSATSSPTASVTPSPTTVDVLPLVPSLSAWGVPITPLATPDLGVASFHLKDWSKADALALIHSLEVFAHDHDIQAPAHGRWEFPHTYESVEVAIREMMYRFPNAPYQDILAWRLAMAQAIQTKTASDQWILDMIEEFINQKSLEELKTYLLPHGFEVAEQVSTTNLFGDGSEAQVMRVQAQESFGQQGLVFAVRKQPDGQLEVIPVYNYWFVNYSEVRIVDTKDHNQNGRSEVVLESWASSGSMCHLDVFIFEWRDGEFVDLSQRQFSSSECLDWGFGEPDSNGIETFTMSQDLIPTIYKTFRWNGNYYELSKQEISHAYDCRDYLQLMEGWNDNQQGLDAMQALLEGWTPEMDKSVRPYCRDFLRLELALAYAVHGQQVDALAKLYALAQSPVELTMPEVSEVAKAFLAKYKSQEDLFQSCVAAEAKITAFPSLVEWYWWVPYSCDRKLIFPILVQSINQSQISNPLPALQGAGAQVLAHAQIDADGDGDLDWLIEVRNQSNVDIWVLLNTRQGFQPIYIDEVSYYDGNDLDTFQAQPVVIPGSGEGYVLIRYGREFGIFQVDENRTEDAVLDVLHDYGVQQFKFQETNQAFEVEITYQPNSYQASLINFFRWDEQEKHFRLLPLYDNDIFSGGGPAEALPYLERIVASLAGVEGDQASEKPRFLYLLGLAYELTGDSPGALQAYWTLWHDYPNSAYALMACSKIEGCVP